MGERFPEISFGAEFGSLAGEVGCSDAKRGAARNGAARLFVVAPKAGSGIFVILIQSDLPKECKNGKKR